ncbi:putative DNA integrase/recombinase [Pseudonocardia sp. Ae263_Ps1]|nr:putative DNA integrase/recombinase [Pseudonocardia sp. Ae263_Ps1]
MRGAIPCEPSGPGPRRGLRGERGGEGSTGAGQGAEGLRGGLAGRWSAGPGRRFCGIASSGSDLSAGTCLVCGSTGPCPVPRAPCPVPRAPCPVPRAPCPVPRAPCPVPRAPCPVPRAPCPVPRAPCPVPRAPCPVPRAPWPVAGGRWPVAGGRWPVAGGRWPVAGGRWPVAGGRGPWLGGGGCGCGRWLRGPVAAGLPVGRIPVLRRPGPAEDRAAGAYRGHGALHAPQRAGPASASIRNAFARVRLARTGSDRVRGTRSRARNPIACQGRDLLRTGHGPDRDARHSGRTRPVPMMSGRRARAGRAS